MELEALSHSSWNVLHEDQHVEFWALSRPPNDPQRTARPRPRCCARFVLKWPTARRPDRTSGKSGRQSQEGRIAYPLAGYETGGRLGNVTYTFWEGRGGEKMLKQLIE